MGGEQEYVSIEHAQLVQSTSGAGLYLIENEQFWIPWTLVDEGSVDVDGERGTLYVAEWFAEKEGIPYY